MVAVDGKTLDNLDDPRLLLASSPVIRTFLVARTPTWAPGYLKLQENQSLRSPVWWQTSTRPSFGRIFDQEGVFRLDDFHYESTGGIDRLKDTKGDHLKSYLLPRSYSATPVDAQSIARNHVQGRAGLLPSLGGQNAS